MIIGNFSSRYNLNKILLQYPSVRLPKPWSLNEMAMAMAVVNGNEENFFFGINEDIVKFVTETDKVRW